MKTILLNVFILMVIGINVQAQDVQNSENDLKTLFDLRKYEKGYYFGSNLNFSNFKSSSLLLSEVNGGLVINHDLYVGLNVNGIVNMPIIHNIDESEDDIYSNALLLGGYGGLMVEKNFFSKKIVHFSVPIQFGGGGLFYMTERRYSQIDNDGNTVMKRKLIDKYGFFYVEPGVNVEINILRFMRFNLGIRYRITTHLDLQGTDSNEFNGFTTAVGLKFGKF